MEAEATLVDCPTRLWRVGRTPEPLNFSEISPDDAAQPSGGNRFDVPGGAVLYAATAAEGAFAETLARFRPTAAMQRLQSETDEHLMSVGAIPADWRTRRQLVEFSLADPLPFLDIDSPATHTYLTQQLAPLLEGIEISNLDVPTVRGSNRFLTRALAQWAYAATDDDGKYRYSGLRYGSRLGNYECWAIFAGASIIEVKTQAIALRNAALLRVAHAFGLSIH